MAQLVSNEHGRASMVRTTPVRDIRLSQRFVELLAVRLTHEPPCAKQGG
jgi:hypothetical protein